MKSFQIILAFTLILISSAKSQHCPFCNSSIYVFEISDEESGEIIPGLTIYFLDSNKNAIGFQQYDYETEDYKIDTIFGWQNPRRNSFHGLIDNNNPFEAQKFRFWFANDGYIIYGHYQAKYLVIEDRRNGKPSEHYRGEVIDLGQSKVFRLCSDFSTWDLGESYGTPNGFVPTYIALKRRIIGIISK